MTKQELIDHLQHLEKYTHYSEDAPALREVIEMLKCSEMPNSSDTISRQAAIALAKDICVPTKDGYVYRHRCIDPDEILRLSSAQPEIVRCKDCRHYKFADNRAFGFPVKRCEWTGFEDIDDNDFCSRAERREG
jgi:hypothetical protein